MRFVWIIIWLPFFFYSCQGVKEERSVRLFHEKVKVNGEFMIGSPLEMKCLDDNLIIVDARSDAFFPDFVNVSPKIHQQTMAQCVDGVSSA